MRLTRGDAELRLLGEKLRRARLDRGLSAQQLADQISLTAGQVRRLEGGKAEPSAIVLARIVRALEPINPTVPYEQTLVYRLLEHILNDEALAEKIWREEHLDKKLPQSKDADFKAKRAILKAMNLWQR